MDHERRTKIVATLGPASDTPERLRALVDAGMDAARLNLSHGSHDDHAERAQRVRDAAEAAGRPIALIADLQGPKLRVGALAEPVVLKARVGDHEVESWAAEVAARHGFSDVSHTIEIFGTCSECGS